MNMHRCHSEIGTQQNTGLTLLLATVGHTWSMMLVPLVHSIASPASVPAHLLSIAVRGTAARTSSVVLLAHVTNVQLVRLWHLHLHRHDIAISKRVKVANTRLPSIGFRS